MTIWCQFSGWLVFESCWIFLFNSKLSKFKVFSLLLVQIKFVVNKWTAQKLQQAPINFSHLIFFSAPEKCELHGNASLLGMLLDRDCMVLRAPICHVISAQCIQLSNIQLSNVSNVSNYWRAMYPVTELSKTEYLWIGYPHDLHINYAFSNDNVSLIHCSQPCIF